MKRITSVEVGKLVATASYLFCSVYIFYLLEVVEAIGVLMAFTVAVACGAWIMSRVKQLITGQTYLEATYKVVVGISFSVIHFGLAIAYIIIKV